MQHQGLFASWNPHNSFQLQHHFVLVCVLVCLVVRHGRILVLLHRREVGPFPYPERSVMVTGPLMCFVVPTLRYSHVGCMELMSDLLTLPPRNVRIIMMMGRMGRLKMRMGKGSMTDGLGGGSTSFRF